MQIGRAPGDVDSDLSAGGWWIEPAADDTDAVEGAGVGTSELVLEAGESFRSVVGIGTDGGLRLDGGWSWAGCYLSCDKDPLCPVQL